MFEGFTSYYDDLMLVRAGLLSEEGYFKMLGKTVGAVLRGSGRTKQSVADSSFDAWGKYYRQDENSPNAIVSYYAKGSLIGLGPGPDHSRQDRWQALAGRHHARAVAEIRPRLLQWQKRAA